MKKIISSIVFTTIVMSTSINAHVTSILETQCVSPETKTGGRNSYYFKDNVHVEKFSISTIYPDNAYAFSIEIEGHIYKTVLKEQDKDTEHRDQFSSTAKIAKALNLPVNLCLDSESGGYLLGIELF
ncbi:hypothetical protein [Candidatus Symbiopectobacterium sp. NZEC135]|uniref:hypothetical protein n=1 Tax=Candidatus Symbiopectobacterium sp. NZEC135 TaxID=2820471 RepID=UPI0022268CF8|nr:hypothetical protein [Candidatus Symbiopectobacterium sp. NZEC135]MCW2481380.1 hypothetical protein [Candidatus Symbiopectobacterium sp. NZEC135]